MGQDTISRLHPSYQKKWRRRPLRRDPMCFRATSSCREWRSTRARSRRPTGPESPLRLKKSCRPAKGQMWSATANCGSKVPTKIRFKFSTTCSSESVQFSGMAPSSLPKQSYPRHRRRRRTRRPGTRPRSSRRCHCPRRRSRRRRSVECSSVNWFAKFREVLKGREREREGETDEHFTSHAAVELLAPLALPDGGHALAHPEVVALGQRLVVAAQEAGQGRRRGRRQRRLLLGRRRHR